MPERIDQEPDAPDLDHVVRARQIGREGAVGRIEPNDAPRRFVERPQPARTMNEDFFDTAVAADGDGDDRIACATARLTPAAMSAGFQDFNVPFQLGVIAAPPRELSDLITRGRNKPIVWICHSDVVVPNQGFERFERVVLVTNPE